MSEAPWLVFVNRPGADKQRPPRKASNESRLLCGVADCLGYGLDEFDDFFGEVLGGAVLADAANDGAADDHGIGLAGDFGGLVGSGNAEADGHGKRGVFFDLGDLGGDADREAGLLAGDAFARDLVNETLGGFRDEFHALRWGRGRDEADREETVGFHQFRVASGFIGREVEDEQTVSSGGRGIGVEAVVAVDVNGIEIGEEDDGDL